MLMSVLRVLITAHQMANALTQTEATTATVQRDF